MQKIRRLFWILALVFPLFVVQVGVASASAPSEKAEKLLIDLLRNVQGLEVYQAIEIAEELSDLYPDYELAQLLAGDLLAAKSGDFSFTDKVYKAYPRSTGRLKQEAQVRWNHAHSDAQQAEQALITSVLKIGSQKHLVLVSLSTSRLYLYENIEGHLELKANYYISMGTAGSGKEKEGDRKTPIGVYHIVDWVPGFRLADLYGYGALPLSYPNEWDKSLGRTGHGIWLHGTPSNTFSRPPQSSQGCVVLNNQEMSSLVSSFNIDLATPVILLDKPRDFMSLVDEKSEVLSEIHSWLVEKNQNFNWQEVSVYSYPNEKNMYYATFPDVENKNNLVHQYWRRDAEGSWKLALTNVSPVQVATRF